MRTVFFYAGVVVEGRAILESVHRRRLVLAGKSYRSGVCLLNNRLGCR